MNEFKWTLHQHSKDRNGPPRFVDVSSIPTYGFCGMYCVPQTTAESITQSGTTAGFKGSVWSERLWIDIDDYVAANKVGERLTNAGIDYNCYDSGSKGLHFHVLRKANPSHLLPQQDKEWVKQYIPEADTTIYTHMHIIRAVGCRHERTRRYKELLRSNRGREIDVTGMSIKSQRLETINECSTSIFDDPYIRINSVPVENGQRHASLVRLAFAIKERGDNPEVAAWYLLEVNKGYRVPKEVEEIEKIVDSVYRSG